MADEDCAASLVPSVSYGALSEYQRLAILSLIDKEQYDRMKESNASGLSIEVDGEQIGATNDYKDFNEHRQREFDRLDYSDTRDVSISYFSSALSPESQHAYESCLKDRLPGLYMYTDTLSSTLAQVRVGYNPAIGDNSSVRVSAGNFINIQNSGEIKNELQGHDWSTTAQHDVVITPTNVSAECSFSVERGDQTVSIIISPLKRDSGTPPHISLADKIAAGQTFVVHFANFSLLGGQSRMGSIYPGVTLTGTYTEGTRTWHVWGPNPGTSPPYSDISSPGTLDPRERRLELWGVSLTFDEDGNVYPGPGEIINDPNAHPKVG